MVDKAKAIRTVVGNVGKALERGRPKGTAQFFDGGKRSIAVLKANNFDPIGKLIELYHKMVDEVKFWEDIRDGKKVVLDYYEKPLRYSADMHANAQNILMNISDKLLRYGYGRVPEGNIEGPVKPSTLVIKLNREGDEFVVGENQPDYLPGELADDEEE